MRGGRFVVMAACVAAAMVVVPAGAGAALASRAATTGDWVEAGFDAANTHNNPSETALNTANVGNLVPSWNKAAAAGSSPLSIGDTIYAESATAVNSFNRVSGNLQWSFPAAGNSFDNDVAYANGVLYAAPFTNAIGGKSFLYALDATTGTLLWKHKTTNFGGRPLVVADGVVYYSDLQRHLFAIDTTTHKQKWRFSAHGDIGRPAIANGIVYAGSFDHKLYALNETTGAKLWSFNTRDELFADPSVANGIVYIGPRSGTMYALDAITGKLRWKFQTAGTYITDAGIANGTIYFGSTGDGVYALNAATGKQVWASTVDSASSTAPVIANGVVYLSSIDKNLYLFDASTGAPLLTFFTGVQALDNVVVSNGNVFLGLPTGHLRRFVLPD